MLREAPRADAIGRARHETAGQRVAHRFHVGIQRLVRREEGKCAEGDSNEKVYHIANAAAGCSRICSGEKTVSQDQRNRGHARRLTRAQAEVRAGRS